MFWSISLCHGFGPTNHFFLLQGLPEVQGSCFYCCCIIGLSPFSRVCWVDADLSTDGRWCFVVLWVVPRVSASTVRWPLLKQRLEHACPSAVDQFLLPCPPPPVLTSKNVFLLQVCSSDRTGLLHGNDNLLYTSMFFWLDLSLSHGRVVSKSPSVDLLQLKV